MQLQLQKLKLGYEFVDACDALAITDEELESANRSVTYGRPLTKGEVACARSHAMACEKLALDPACKFGLILEDDAMIGSALPDILRRLECREKTNEAILLYATPYREVVFSVQEQLTPDYHLLRPVELHEIFGLVAYFLSAEKALELSKALVPVKTIADDWRGYLDAGIFSSLQTVFPFPVLHAEFYSVVRGDAKPVDLRTKVKNFVYINKFFPFYQIVLAIRRKKAEIVRKKNITIPDIKFHKTYKL